MRKLEYLAVEALARDCDTLVSIGGVQSNHTRQVAAVAARLGLRCVLVQEHWVDWPDAIYEKVGNILLSRIMGAEVRLDPAGFDIGFRDSWEQALASVEEQGGKPYAIPAGASDHPLSGSASGSGGRSASRSCSRSKRAVGGGRLLIAEVFVASPVSGHEPSQAPGRDERRWSIGEPRSSYSSRCAGRRLLRSRPRPHFCKRNSFLTTVVLTRRLRCFPAVSLASSASLIADAEGSHHEPRILTLLRVVAQ